MATDQANRLGAFPDLDRERGQVRRLVVMRKAAADVAELGSGKRIGEPARGLADERRRSAPTTTTLGRGATDISDSGSSHAGTAASSAKRLCAARSP